MPIRSMTGFARVSRALPSGELTLSLKAVNHRGFDLHFHMPPEFDAVEPAIRSAIRKRISRGHIQVQLFYRRNADNAGAIIIDETLVKAWLDSFREMTARYGIDSKPDLNHALRLQGMVASRGAEKTLPDEAVEREALAIAAEAIEELDRFRAREGAAIESELRGRAASIRQIVTQMQAIREQALPYFHRRLKDRLGELLGGTQIDPARLAQEAAILAERSDISEELVRLKSHSDQTDALLSDEGETGKKLDFLLQEMNRETNTILSKTGGLGETGLKLTDLGLAAKAEIDRLREQSLNIE